MAQSPLLFWAGGWNTWPISLSPSVAPHPLCTDCVGKGCNYSCDGCYFHVSARINPDRRHTWCVNDDPLGFAPVFHTLFVFPYFLPTSSVLSSSGLLPFYLFSVLALCFLLDFHLSF